MLFDRLNVRLVTIALVATGLAACTTIPGSESRSESPPAQTGTFARLLHLCNGDHIDNAPATDSKKHILGYKPLTTVSGVTLARAPVRKACVSSGFGPRHDRAGRHNGIDLSTGHGHKVYAGGDGVIEQMHVASGYGKMILIRHNSHVQTRYGHLASYGAALHVGHKVKRGDVVALTGKTGNATAIILHYEIIVDGVPRNPITVGR